MENKKKPEKKQIVITGYGVITALGKSKEENEKLLFEGKTGIQPYCFEYKDGNATSAAGVYTEKMETSPFFEKNHLPFDRASNLALIAAEESIQESGIMQSDYNPLRVGIIMGTSLGGMRSADKFHTQWIEEGIEHADSTLLKQYPLHAIVDVLAKNYGFQGAKAVISTACSSGANAIGAAADLLDSGLYDVILTGGVDPISRFSFAGFTSLGAIDPDFCRPYSASTGINLGEGAACFVLETAEHAQARNAKILGEIRGYGITADAYHPTAPDISGNGAVRAMKIAMENGCCTSNELSYINGHGTGTKANDKAETKAWKSFVGENTDIPLISNKASVGHCMGAAGAVEIAFSLMSIQNNKIPPTLNFPEDYVKKEINFVPNHAQEKEVKCVLSNSFAFGGNNCSVLISEYQPCQMPEKCEDDIVITGIGAVGTGGTNIDELFETFSAGTNWIIREDTEGKEFNTPYRGKIPEIDYKKYIPGKVLRRVDHVTRLAMVSGREALLNSGLKVTPKNNTRIGVIYGTGTGPLETIEHVSRKIIEEGKEGVDAGLFPNTVLNAAPGQFSIANMLKGPTSTISAGSVSGMDAFIYAAELLKKNQADAIVVLTADEWNEPLQTGNECLGLLTKNGALPFSKNATGMVLSEGSTAFVLERKEKAKERNAKILAEIYGYAMTSDNGELCGFDKSGTQWSDSLRIAKERANVSTVDYYASTAYGIPVVDEKEEKLMEDVLDEDTVVRSIPSLIGAPSGSLGTYGLLSCIYALTQDSVSKQNIAEDNIREKAGKFLMREKKKEIACTAVSAASFGGSYSSIIVGKER